MNRLDDAVGLSRYQRARFNRLLAAFPPLPESREGKGALVFELEIVGGLATRTGPPQCYVDISATSRQTSSRTRSETAW
jgi:hypothetical protein